MRYLVLSALFLFTATACTVKDPPPIEAAWSDDFERAQIGGNYRPTADNYKIVNGALSAQGAMNHPLWLRKKLPIDVSIELDCWSNTADGDIKVELFGDGHSHGPEKGGAYTSTGYVVVMGGWNNSKTILAKGDEHGKEIVVLEPPRKVERGKHYHWKVVRKGNTLDWYLDDMATPYLHLEDGAALKGDGHHYFGFNNWKSDTWFDNLSITPL